MTPRLISAFVTETLQQRAGRRYTEAMVAGFIHMDKAMRQNLIERWAWESGHPIKHPTDGIGSDGWRRIPAKKTLDWLKEHGDIKTPPVRGG